MNFNFGVYEDEQELVKQAIAMSLAEQADKSKKKQGDKKQ